MRIIVPLADNENIKFENATLYIRSKECDKYNHIWFSEIGKLLYLKNTFIKSNDIQPIAFIQNRRFFNDINSIQLNAKDEVVLAPLQSLCGHTILSQLKTCHRQTYQLYEMIVKKNFEQSLYSKTYLSPHNIFVADVDFCVQYCHWLELNLEPYFDKSATQKYGAWMCQRFLHLFSNKYFKVQTKQITTLRK